VQISGLIFSRRSLRLNDSLHSCRHAMYKVQTQFLANFGAPHSFYSSSESEVVQTFRVFLSHFDLEETPQVFNRIHVPWWVVTAPQQFLRTGALPWWAVRRLLYKNNYRNRDFIPQYTSHPLSAEQTAKQKFGVYKNSRLHTVYPLCNRQTA